MNKIKLDKLDKKGNFFVNDFLTIQKFKIVSEEIFKFMKFGEEYDYLKFNGEIENKKVQGFVCIADENIYNMTYLEN